MRKGSGDATVELSTFSADGSSAKLSLAGGSGATVVYTIVPTPASGYLKRFTVVVTTWKQTDSAKRTTAVYDFEALCTGTAWSLDGSTTTLVGGNLAKGEGQVGVNITMAVHAGGAGFDVTVTPNADNLYIIVQTWIGAGTNLS